MVQGEEEGENYIYLQKIRSFLHTDLTLYMSQLVPFMTMTFHPTLQELRRGLPLPPSSLFSIRPPLRRS